MPIYHTKKSVARLLQMDPMQIVRDSEKGWLTPDAYYLFGTGEAKPMKQPLYSEATVEKYRLILAGYKAGA